MLNSEDIQKIIEANKEVFVTKEEFENSNNNLLSEIFGTKKELEDFREEMRKNFSDLQSAVDVYAKKADA